MARRNRPRRPAEPEPTEPIPFGPPVSRRERFAVAAVVLLAAGLRFAFPDRMAIEHFDEGVYASNIFFGPEEGNRYPYRHLYAPPLLPWLIEWLIVFLGPEGIAPFLPALVLGTATVPLAWWAARCWFGPAAGLAAGLLVATSDFHLLYSRTALTDAPVAFFLLLAVYLYWEAVRRRSLAWSAAAGLATGLAWWTKYTGWLPLAIAAAGSVAWVLFEKRAAGASLPARARAAAACVAVMAVTAFAVWSPVLWGLQPYGGYAAVAENHRGYLMPVGMWDWNARRHAEQLATESGVLTAVGIAFAIIASVGAWRDGFRWILSLCSAAAISAISISLGPAVPLLIFGLLGPLVTAVEGACRGPSPAAGLNFSRLAAWLIAAWFLGMLITTPLYHVYPRLSMPWLMAAWFGTSSWAIRTGSDAEVGSRFTTRDLWLITAFVATVIAIPIVLSPRQEQFTAGLSVPGWQDRNGLAAATLRATRAIREDRPDRDRPLGVYVFAEPAAFFHLSASPRPEKAAIIPSGNLSIVFDPPPGATVYVVGGPNGHLNVMTPDVRLVRNRMTRVDQFHFRPSTLVRLDRELPPLQNNPADLDDYWISVFRVDGT